jgi:hypothetical protein
VILVILVLLIGLVLLIPTIASTGAVRSMVVGKVNQNLNGHVEIGNWSLGWSSPTVLSGVKVYDEQNRLILDIPNIKLGLSVLEAARQDFQFGPDNQIDIASLVVRVDENGKTNFQKLVKEQPAGDTATTSPSGTAEPAKLPDLSGSFAINILGGSIDSAGNPSVTIEQSSITANIPSINSPIENNVQLSYRIGDTEPSTIKANGTVDAIENNVVDLDGMTYKETVGLTQVQLAAAKPFLSQPNQPPTELGGAANGVVSLEGKGLAALTSQGQIVIDNFLFGGGALNGDLYKSKKVIIPINVTRAAGNDAQPLIKIEKLGATLDDVVLAVTGQVPEQALLNLSQNKAPGGSGTIALQADVTDPAGLIAQLPNTIPLEKGVKITGGNASENLDLTITNDNVAIAQKLIAGLKGTRDGKPIEIKPITVTAGTTAIPTGKPIPDLRNIKLGLTSTFATLTGAGESLAALDVTGNADLAKLQAEAGQFVDLQGKQLSGTADLKVSTRGDVLNENSPITGNGAVNLKNLNVVGVLDQPLKQDQLDVNFGGEIARSGGAFNTLNNGTVSLASTSGGTQLLTASAKASQFDLNKMAGGFEFAVDTGALARLQSEFGGLVPALAQQDVKITNGGFHIKGAGTYDGSKLSLTQPLVLSAPSLVITKNGKPLLDRDTIRGNIQGDLAMGQDRIDAVLKTLDLKSEKGLFNVSKVGDAPLSVTVATTSGNFQGNGSLKVDANLKSLADIAQSLGGPATQPSDAPRLASGMLNSTIALSGTDQLHKVDFNGNVGSLTVANGRQNALQNETITIALSGAAPANLQGNQPLQLSGKVGSAFVNANLSDVKVLLNAPELLDMLQTASIDVEKADLPKLYALSQAFAPPAALAAPTARARPSGAVIFAQAAPPSGSDRISSPAPEGRGNSTARPDDVISTPRPDQRPTTPPPQQQQPQPRPAQRPRGDRGDAVSPPPAASASPLEVLGGTASMKVALTRDVGAKTTNLTVSDAQISDLALRRGDEHFDARQPITVALAAQVKGSSPDNLQSLQVQQLKINSGFANVEATKPINMTLGQQPIANGELRVAGSFDNASSLITVLQGQPLPFGGDFTVVQTLSGGGGASKLAGSIDVTNFKVYDENHREQFTENQIAIRNDVNLDLNQHNAAVNTLTVDMPNSHALGVKFTGQVLDWVNARTIKGLGSDPAARLELSYTLEKLWPIIRPLLAPETQEQYKTLEVAGTRSQVFTVWGAFPNRPAFNESIKSLNAKGGFSLDKLVLPQGLNISAFDLGIEMANGVARTSAAEPIDARKLTIAPATEGGRPRNITASTAVANDGALNLDGITIDLTASDPLLTVERRHILLRGIKLNPVLADSIGKIGAVLLLGSTQAEGLLTINVLECDRVPMGALIQHSKNAEARIAVAIENLHLNGLVPQLLSKAGNFGTEGLRGNVTDSSITLKDGVANSSLTLDVLKSVRDDRTGRDRLQAFPLKVVGDMTLKSLSVDSQVSFPAELLSDNLKKSLPNGIVLPLTGSGGALKLDLSKIATSNLGNLIPGLGGGGSGGGGNPLEDLLKQLDPNSRNQPQQQEQPRQQQPRPRQQQ